MEMISTDNNDPVTQIIRLSGRVAAILLFSLLTFTDSFCQLLPGFKPSGIFNEQQLYMEDNPPGTRILLNAPLSGFEKERKILLVLYALPNGNTIEQTSGKKLKKGDDWHYNIQHIAAQTRFLRDRIKERTVVVAYLQANGRSWSQWVGSTPDSVASPVTIAENIISMFRQWDTDVQLNSHSGGGRFIFTYLERVEKVPQSIKSISFLDSNYGYEDTLAGPKLVRWLKDYSDTRLTVIAYNDSVVIFNGKQLVSPTGGTWYRSKMMKDYLSGSFGFNRKEGRSLIRYCSPGNRIEIILKKNPGGKIYHTVQVERNGFIHSVVQGTANENRGYRYFGRRAYNRYIADTVVIPIRDLNIPARSGSAETGSGFMSRIDTLKFAGREEEIFRAIAAGNIPSFLRRMVHFKCEFAGASGTLHTVEFEVMPDYLAVGNDSDFCRIPMSPYTAQRLASCFGASLITARISDFIYENAEVKVAPFNYVPVGNANELVSKFADHNRQIERQISEAGGKHGSLVAGIKKDVILSSRIADRPDRVVIYGWHKPDGKPIQPVYSGHIWWYVDYSHGIRLMNNQVVIDGKPAMLTDILQDPEMYRLFSNEDLPMRMSVYPVK